LAASLNVLAVISIALANAVREFGEAQNKKGCWNFFQHPAKG
jgi:hypothetical protein